ncbi:hypothetical protein NX059_002356 [Plenodomus lindquistii]|nr:hypothetical protein NX059_002356 [Plenodomus lindquistii]
MAPPADDAPCHLLRLPYEILKPILVKLSQRDQINAAKTCVQLWELAYPLAYNRLVVEVGPKTKESHWTALASGVGLGYVQHLEIRSTFQVGDQPARVFELAVSTIIAHLRRDSLRSMSFITSGLAWEIIRVRDVTVLLEAQYQLSTLSLPRLSGEGAFDLQGYQRPIAIKRNINALTIYYCADSACHRYLDWLTNELSDPKELHLWFSSSATGHPWQRDVSRSFFKPLKCDLFKVTSKLTLSGYAFGDVTPSGGRISFPVLRALAIVDCEDVGLFCLMVPGNSFPSLTALKLESKSLTFTVHELEFIHGFPNLRELLVHGEIVHIADGSELFPEAGDLELLSLKNHDKHSVFWNKTEAAAAVTTLSALRFLSIGVGNCCYHGSWEDIAQDVRNGITTLLKAVSASGNLKTLHIQTHLPRIDHDNVFGSQESVPVDISTYVEELVGQVVLEELDSHNDLPGSGSSLEFLSVYNELSLILRNAAIDSRWDYTPWQQSRGRKRMFSRNATPGFRDADKVKDEIMEKYAADGYCFLEDFVAGMMEVSRGRFKSQ